MGNNQYKYRKQPEVPEHQNIWKSNNQGLQEDTFIQTGRVGGDGKPGWRASMTRWLRADQGRLGSPTFMYG